MFNAGPGRSSLSSVSLRHLFDSSIGVAGGYCYVDISGATCLILLFGTLRNVCLRYVPSSWVVG